MRMNLIYVSLTRSSSSFPVSQFFMRNDQNQPHGPANGRTDNRQPVSPRELSRFGQLWPNYRGGHQPSSAMAGHFCHWGDEGFSVHAVDVLETLTETRTTQMPSGVSFCFLFSGTIGFNLDGRAFELTSADGAQSFLIRHGENGLLSRRLESGRTVSKVTLWASERWLTTRSRPDDPPAELGALLSHCTGPHPWPCPPAAFTAAEAFLDLPSPGSLTERVAFEHRALGLLAACLGAGAEARPAADRTQPASSRGTIATSIRQLIDRRLNSGLSISVQTLAQQLHLSTSTLQRRFKRAYGMSVIEYARMYRLNQAKRALVFGNASIQEAAGIGGYDHASNFTTAFRRQFGMTPLQAIRMHRAN